MGNGGIYGKGQWCKEWFAEHLHSILYSDNVRKPNVNMIGFVNVNHNNYKGNKYVRMEEVATAMKAMKKGKASTISEITSEVLKFWGCMCVGMVMDDVHNCTGER